MSAKKFIKFTKREDGSYIVMNHKKQFLGDIVKERKLWKFYPDDKSPMEEKGVWFTEGCLREIVAFIESLKGIPVNIEDKIRAVLRECHEYLAPNPLNSIESGSILHQEIQERLK